MATLRNAKRVTYEEWLHLPETDDAIEEVVDGAIILIPPAKLRHARVVDNLKDVLRRDLDRDHYDIFTGSFGIVISERPLTCRNPDLAVCERASEVEKDGYLRSAPQLLVEVVSPSESRRMTERKLQDYETISTPEVWVITPEDRAVEIFLLEKGVLERAAILTAGLLKPRAFPHGEIDISEIWPD